MDRFTIPLYQSIENYFAEKGESTKPLINYQALLDAWLKGNGVSDSFEIEDAEIWRSITPIRFFPFDEAAYVVQGDARLPQNLLGMIRIDSNIFGDYVLALLLPILDSTGARDLNDPLYREFVFLNTICGPAMTRQLLEETSLYEGISEKQFIEYYEKHYSAAFGTLAIVKNLGKTTDGPYKVDRILEGKSLDELGVDLS